MFTHVGRFVFVFFGLAFLASAFGLSPASGQEKAQSTTPASKKLGDALPAGARLRLGSPRFSVPAGIAALVGMSSAP